MIKFWRIYYIQTIRYRNLFEWQYLKLDLRSKRVTRVVPLPRGLFTRINREIKIVTSDKLNETLKPSSQQAPSGSQ